MAAADPRPPAPGEFRVKGAPPAAPTPQRPDTRSRPAEPRPALEAAFEPIAEPKPDEKKGTSTRPADAGKGTSLQDQVARVVDTIKQAEILVKLCADAEKDKIRMEYMQRYKHAGAFESDPEYQIRLRGVDREADRKKAEVQHVLKLMQSTEPAMQQLAAREKRVEAQEKSLREHEGRLKVTEKEVDRKEQEAAALQEKRKADVELELGRKKAEADAIVQRGEAEAKRRADAAAAVAKQSELEAKERIEAIAQTSREVDELQAKLGEELKHIDDVLRAAKQDLAEKLQLVLKEAQATLEHARRDIDDLLS